VFICRTINEMRDYVRQAREQSRTIGFVPTMGFFHEGHLALMREAKKICSVVVVSIFVNPTQFGPKEDFNEYPRDFERDIEMARETGVDAIFAPSVQEIYPPGFSTSVEITGVTQCLCGLSRPGHFQGVATVVAKLFNIVLPDKAFFGQKDAQQVLVIKRMVKDLDMPLEIVTVPTMREQDGLAMSSRNVYLQPKERQAALVISKALKAAEQAVAGGEKNVSVLEGIVRRQIAAEPLARLDYAEIRSLPVLGEVDYLEGPALLAIALYVGKTRLIDNIVLSPGGNTNVFNNI